MRPIVRASLRRSSDSDSRPSSYYNEAFHAKSVTGVSYPRAGRPFTSPAVLDGSEGLVHADGIARIRKQEATRYFASEGQESGLKVAANSADSLRQKASFSESRSGPLSRMRIDCGCKIRHGLRNGIA
jgi:hypothetical protein